MGAGNSVGAGFIPGFSVVGGTGDPEHLSATGPARSTDGPLPGEQRVETSGRGRGLVAAS